ncbi:MAG: MerR family DNA-binding protein, partial [Cereibacter sp.]
EIARMTLILRGRRFGFSLEEIRPWLLIHETRGTSAQLRALAGLADRQLAQLRRQRDGIETAIAELQSLRDRAAASTRSGPVRQAVRRDDPGRDCCA